MSNSANHTPQDDDAPTTPTVPRALIHKKILDRAEAQPDASLAELAAFVNGASEDLVEKVLTEYGDPANNQPTTDDVGSNSQMSQHTSTPESQAEPVDDHDLVPDHQSPPIADLLSEKQLEALQALANHPEATQRELAEHLEVSTATVNKRLNSIDGFEWENRQEYAKTTFENGDTPQAAQNSSGVSTEDVAARVETLATQVESVEQQLNDRSPTPHAICANPDLVHKILHACLNSERITEDEELEIISAILNPSGRPK